MLHIHPTKVHILHAIDTECFVSVCCQQESDPPHCCSIDDGAIVRGGIRRPGSYNNWHGFDAWDKLAFAKASHLKWIRMFACGKNLEHLQVQIEERLSKTHSVHFYVLLIFYFFYKPIIHQKLTFSWNFVTNMS